MFRITEDPSSGSLVLCLTKNNKNDSIVSCPLTRHVRIIFNLFKHFIILIVSTNYILCISWIMKCLMKSPTYSLCHVIRIFSILCCLVCVCVYVWGGGAAYFKVQRSHVVLITILFLLMVNENSSKCVAKIE